MGTRHLIAVMIDGEYRIAQYGQWDGYPEGQGSEALSFLSSLNGSMDDFRDKVRRLEWISQDEYMARWVECGADPDTEWVDRKVSQLFKERYPELSRDTGSKILDLVASGAATKLNNKIGFVSESLWCEWAYVIDLDKNTFEVFKGFNQYPLPEGERFASFPADESYYPVSHVKTFDITNLPTEGEFLDAIGKAVGWDEED